MIPLSAKISFDFDGHQSTIVSLFSEVIMIFAGQLVTFGGILSAINMNENDQTLRYTAAVSHAWKSFPNIKDELALIFS